MSGPILHLGATVTCSHGGQALPTTPTPRVLVSGQPVVTQTSPWTVAGCGFTPPSGNGPCVSATFVDLGQGRGPVSMKRQLFQHPTSTPLIPVQAQTRVIGI